jgi:ribose transport system substrate-binding protein
VKANRKFWFVILLFLGLFGMLFISTYLYITDSSNQDKNTKISVIVYGNNSDRWATLKHGIDQGAADYGAQVNFVTMTEESDYKEQKRLLGREIDNGADGIIIAATDSNAMADAVEKASLTLPVVLIETNVAGVSGLDYLTADNYSMGLNIGRSVILNSEESKKVAVLMENRQRSSIVERFDGFMDSLKYSDYEIDLWEREEDNEDLPQFIQDKLAITRADIVVALDDSTLEAVIDALGTYDAAAEVYGIGSTNKIIHYLDYGIIQSIVFQNEFNMGYLSVQELFKDNKDKVNNYFETEIEFRTINRETMYLPKNQRLIFPIIQ